jgi:hypothetical protein
MGILVDLSVSIKIRIQVTDKNAQGVSVVREERVVEIPLSTLTANEQGRFIEPLAEWAVVMKDKLEGQLRSAGLHP